MGKHSENRMQAVSSASGWRHILLIGALAAIGVWLRLGEISATFFSVDEGMQLQLVLNSSFAELFYIRNQAHPPGFFLLLKGLLSILPADPYVARYIQCLFGIACLPVAYLVGATLAGSSGAIISLGLLSFSTGAIIQSQVIRHYSISLFLMFLIVLLALRFFNTPCKNRAFGIAILLAVGVFVHYIFVPCIPIIAVLVGWRLRDAQPKKMAICLLPFLLPLSLAAYVSLRYSGQTGSATFWIAYAREQYLNMYFSSSLPGLLLNLLDSSFYLLNYPTGILALFLYLMGVWSLWRDGKRYVLALGLVIPAAFVLISCLGWFPYGGTRHILPLFAFCILPVVYAIIQLLDRKPRGTMAGIFVALLLLFPHVGVHLSLQAAVFPAWSPPLFRPIIFELPGPRSKMESAFQALPNRLKGYDFVVCSRSAYWQMYPWLLKNDIELSEYAGVVTRVLLSDVQDRADVETVIASRREGGGSSGRRVAVLLGEWDAGAQALPRSFASVLPGVDLLSLSAN